MKKHEMNFVVYAVTESDYGGQFDVEVAYFEKYYDAKTFAETSSPNWPRSVKTRTINHTYNVFESLDDYYANNTNKKREDALAKLTKEERDLLRLS